MAFVYLERNPRPTRPAPPPVHSPERNLQESVAPAASASDESKADTRTEAAKNAATTQAAPAQSGAAKTPTQPETAAAANKSAAVTATARPAAAAGPLVLEFDKDTYVATESDGSVRIMVERHGAQDRAVSFRWSLRGNSAEQGSDFAGIGPGTETIAARASTATLTIPLVSDAIVENTEVFLVEIEPAQSGVTLGERSHAAVIVVDDD
jgi:hypothetical protein